MDCCETDGFKRPIEIREEPTLDKSVRRRVVLKGAGLLAGTAPLVAGSTARGLAKSGTIQLAFCSAILCVAPFEVTRAGGYFRDEGVDVNLVYMRGSTAATQSSGSPRPPACRCWRWRLPRIGSPRSKASRIWRDAPSVSSRSAASRN